MRLLLVILTLLTSGCAATYVPPRSGKVADLVLPVQSSDWNIIDGYEAEKVIFGLGDQDNCGDFFDAIPPAKEGDQEVTIQIPAASTVFLIYISNNRYVNCTAEAAFKAEALSTYQVRRLGEDSNGCGLQVYLLEKSGDSSIVPLLDIHKPNLVGRTCLK